MSKHRGVGLLVLSLFAPLALADESSMNAFEMPAFDATAGIETETRHPWRQSMSYEYGEDDEGTPLFNRLAWRLQWEGLSSEHNYWVVDAKLRALTKEDIQNEREDEWDVDGKLNALYWQRSLGAGSVQLGFQSVNLGFMDMLIIGDVLTPWDYSEAVFTSPEDARIGQPLLSGSRFDAHGQWDIYINLLPTSNRYPTNNLTPILDTISGGTPYSLVEQEAEGSEWVLRRQQRNGAHEQQFILARLKQNEPSLTINSPVDFRLTYPEYEMANYGYSYTHGNHQWKLEAAYKDGVSVIELPGQQIRQRDVGVGWEYNANGAYTLALEQGRSTRIIDLPIVPEFERDVDQTMLRWMKAFRHETINLTLFAGRIHPGDIKLLSLAASYKPSDSWLLEWVSINIDSDSEVELFNSSNSLKLRYFW